ncbi:MAG TPA: alpha/beta hydrolase [Streptosporangiaceae bacterium]|nr:alpha/beta hydrolase [Streptosporangiaceae bacterium]
MSEPSSPHPPGEQVDLGGYPVFVRTMPGTEPDREPALFVHGLGGSSRNWTELMDLLRSGLDCAAVDLPGFGDSPPRPDGRYSMDALAQTTATLIERQGRGPVHLVGNSLGGAVCLRLAARRPHLVKTLTLISPALPDPHPRLDLVRFPLVGIPRLGDWLLTRYQTLPAERRVAATFTTCYADPARVPEDRFEAEVAELKKRDTLPYAADALIGCVRTITSEALRPWSGWHDAPRIEVPTLVIFGTDDRLVNARLAGRAARAFRNARVVVLPDTGHVAQMEHPEQVAAEMRALGIPAHAGRLSLEG